MPRKHKKNSFQQRYRSVTQVGKTLGMTGRELGAKLKELGLREADGRPTQATLDEGLAVSTPLKDGRPHYMWDAKALRKRLKSQGVERDPEAVANLKVRETLSDIAKLLESDGFKSGGGLGYKIAIEMLFEDYLPRLPLPHDLERVSQAINETKVSRETKDYMLSLAHNCCAGSEQLDDTTARLIVEHETDWRILEKISHNQAISDDVQKVAWNNFLAQAPEEVTQKYSSQLRIPI